VTPAEALRSGQLICGMNATRLQLNNAMRAAAGYGASVLPSDPGEKIICLKNQNDIGLINGMFVTLEDVVDEGSLYFSAVVRGEDGALVQPPDARGRSGRLRIYKGHFEDHLAFDRERHDRDLKQKKQLTEATLAITAHKAQGAQWENVIVWDVGSVADSAVRLFPIPSDGHLGVAEGIETALSAAAIFGIPTWAALSDDGVARWQWPAEVSASRSSPTRATPADGRRRGSPTGSISRTSRAGSLRRSMATTSTTTCSAARPWRTTRRRRQRVATPRSRRWLQLPRDRALRPRCLWCPIWKPPPSCWPIRPT
jgi:Toprim domain-containing protein